jgi:hypothetical protein
MSDGRPSSQGVCPSLLELKQKEEQSQRPEQARGLDPIAVLPSLAGGWGRGGYGLFCDGSFQRAGCTGCHCKGFSGTSFRTGQLLNVTQPQIVALIADWVSTLLYPFRLSLSHNANLDLFSCRHRFIFPRSLKILFEAGTQ